MLVHLASPRKRFRTRRELLPADVLASTALSNWGQLNGVRRRWSFAQFPQSGAYELAL
jgi:hypothetical protein